MGWAFGKAPDGRDIGYGVEATCEHPGCTEKIDRGLSYLCGGPCYPPSDCGCGHYFCPTHQHHAINEVTDEFIEGGGQLCEKCCKEVEALCKEEAGKESDSDRQNTHLV